MTLQRRIITLLDRPALRPILAFLATRYAIRKTGTDTQIFYDDAWLRRSGDLYLAESTTFDWNAAQISQDLHTVLDMYRDWWFYRYQPRPADIVVDIGAGIGEDAIIFSRAAGRVLSVEAHPVTFRLLQKTCRYNKLENTIAVHRAITDQAGTVRIESRAGYKGNTIGAAGDIAVPALSLDELCAEQNVDHIDFLKMNIEGAERLAIRGMSRMIERTGQVCIACHDFLGEQNEFYRTKAVVAEFLQKHGFEIAFREQHPDPWVRDHVYGRRKT